jgi:hypothetical protein
VLAIKKARIITMPNENRHAGHGLKVQLLFICSLDSLRTKSPPNLDHYRNSNAWHELTPTISTSNHPNRDLEMKYHLQQLSLNRLSRCRLETHERACGPTIDPPTNGLENRMPSPHDDASQILAAKRTASCQKLWECLSLFMVPHTSQPLC